MYVCMMKTYLTINSFIFGILTYTYTYIRKYMYTYIILKLTYIHTYIHTSCIPDGAPFI